MDKATISNISTALNWKVMPIQRNVPPSVRVHQSQWSRLFYRHYSPPSYTVESTWSCKFKWKRDHEPLANMLIEIPRNTHIVIPAQKTGPAASKGYPAGTWQFFKWTKKKRFQENLDNELLVDSLRSTVATVGPPAVCFQVAVLYLGRRTYQVCYWGFLTSDFQMFSTYFQQH